MTYAHKLDKAEARLDFTRPAIELERKVRAFDPWPVAEGEVNGETLRVWAARAIEGSGAPGSVLGMNREGIDIACGEGALRVTALQRAGGKRITAADYFNAMKTRNAMLVIPAQAGIQWRKLSASRHIKASKRIAGTERYSYWIPACAGMTIKKPAPRSSPLLTPIHYLPPP